jgi:HK97 family phage major capsid protein
MIKELRDSLSATLARMEEIDQGTVGDGGEVRALNDAENKEYSELEAKAESLRSAIKRAEKRADANSDIERLREPAKTPKITVVREENHNDEGEFRGFSSLGEQLQSVHRSAFGREDDRLKQLRAASGHNATNDSDGGFAIQSDFVSELYSNAIQASQVASLCREFPISSGANAIEYVTIEEDSRADGSRNGGVQAYWTAEAADITASKAKLKQNRIQLEKLAALTYVTEEMLEDAAFLTSWINQLYSEEMSFKLDSAVIEGDGAVKPFGILSSPAFISVTKVTGQSAATVVAGNITAMWSRLLPASRSRAVWLINPEVEDQLPLMTIGDQPVYLPPGGLTERPHGTLLGRPVILAEACEKLGTAGDIILADLNRYALARKGTVKGDVSMHVRFVQAESAFRFILRANGQPLISKAVTPYKGTSGRTLSAFVGTAVRA